MATAVSGLFYSDKAVGEKEDVTEEMMELVPSGIPFLRSIGWPGSAKAKKLVHQYIDEAYVPLKTTLNGSIGAGDASLVLTDAKAKVGTRILIEGELISLDSCPTGDNLTFNITRSVGTIAAAAHTTGATVSIIGKAEAQGTDAGSADTVFEPRTVTNYCQTHERVIEVSYEANVMERYGRPGTLYDDNVRKNMAELMIEVEMTDQYGKKNAVAPTPSAAGKYWADGVFERVFGTNHLQMAGADLGMSNLRTISDALAEYWEQGEAVNPVIMIPRRQAHIFNEWHQAHVFIDGSKVVDRYGVKVLEISVGDVVFDVVAASDRITNKVMGCVYNPKFIRPLIYADMSPKHEILAKTGRKIKGMITVCHSLECFCPEAHYAISGLHA